MIIDIRTKNESFINSLDAIRDKRKFLTTNTRAISYLVLNFTDLDNKIEENNVIILRQQKEIARLKNEIFTFFEAKKRTF